jgi:enterochelin esterase-like enzyme
VWRSASRERGWAWLVALFAQTFACRHEPQRAVSWFSDGGELGRQVDHGSLPGVQRVRFQSATLAQEVGAVVLTPPGYDARPEQRFPVFYVFPGIGGDEWTYLRGPGRESSAVKALFADPERAPLLVFANPADTGGHGKADVVLAQELVGVVDRQFRTRADARWRALEGFSLGGVTALNLLLHHPDVFGHAVALSSACYLLPSCDAIRKGLVAQAKLHSALPVMLGVGEREIAQNRAISAELAPLLRVPVVQIAGADHDWAAQLASVTQGRSLGQRISEFHLAGFAGEITK